MRKLRTSQISFDFSEEIKEDIPWQSEISESPSYNEYDSIAHDIFASIRSPVGAMLDPDPIFGYRYRCKFLKHLGTLFRLAGTRSLLDSIYSQKNELASLNLTKSDVPFIFEEYVSGLCEFVWNCESELTPKSNDGGIDALLKDSQSSAAVAGVQAKYYSGTVGSVEVRTFHGSLSLSKHFLKAGLLFTTAEKVVGMPSRMAEPCISVVNKDVFHESLEVLKILANNLPSYSNLVSVFTIKEYDEYYLCAKLIALRERLENLVRPPPGWPFQLRRELGVDDSDVKPWRNLSLGDY